MASITLQVGAEYATGTTVSVYNTVNSVPIAPVGSVVTTGVVGSDGTVHLSGLTAGINYLTYAVSGAPQYVRFYVPAVGSGASGTSGVILAWAADTDYQAGQAVTNASRVYTANDDHRAGATFAGDKTAHWTLLPAGVMSTATPLANSATGSSGTSPVPANEDHVHPDGSGILLPSGSWVPGSIPQNSFGTPPIGREYCMGYNLAPQRIKRLAILKTGTPDAGAVIRLGIRADLNRLPGAPAYQEAVAAGTAGNATLVSSVINYDHPGGPLWVTWTSQSWVTTGPGLRWGALPVSFALPWAAGAYFGGGSETAPGALDAGSGVYVAAMDGVTGVLPTTFTATNTSANLAHLYLWRA